jgi:hypothetical protein
MERVSFAVAHVLRHEPAGTAFGVLVFFAAPPEVSAIAATSGYCLPTLRVEERSGRVARLHRDIHHQPEGISHFRFEISEEE